MDTKLDQDKFINLVVTQSSKRSVSDLLLSVCENESEIYMRLIIRKVINNFSKNFGKSLYNCEEPLYICLKSTLDYLCSKGNLERINVFFEEGMSPKVFDMCGSLFKLSPMNQISIAVKKNKGILTREDSEYIRENYTKKFIECIEYLHSKGVDMNIVKGHSSGKRITYLHNLSSNDSNSTLIEKLLDLGADAAILDYRNYTPYMVAIEHYSEKIMRIYIEHDIDLTRNGIEKIFVGTYIEQYFNYSDSIENIVSRIMSDVETTKSNIKGY